MDSDNSDTVKHQRIKSEVTYALLLNESYSDDEKTKNIHFNRILFFLMFLVQLKVYSLFDMIVDKLYQVKYLNF